MICRLISFLYKEEINVNILSFINALKFVINSTEGVHSICCQVLPYNAHGSCFRQATPLDFSYFSKHSWVLSVSFDNSNKHMISFQVLLTKIGLKIEN